MDSPDENTPLSNLNQDPKLKKRQAKQLHCCICTGIFASILIAIIIAVCFSIFGVDTTSNETKSVETFDFDENSSVPTNYFTLFPLIDEPELNWTLPKPSENDLQEALDSGKEALGSKEILEEIIVAPVLNSPTYRHQRAVGATHKARQLAKRGYVEDYATQYLAKKYRFKKTNQKSTVGKGPITNLDKKNDLYCSPNAPYRTYDGTCNNRVNQYWGAAYIPFRRALNPDYCDGISSPRCATDKSDTLPSARDISVTVHRPSYFNDQHFTVMLAVWGQFLDHDITATALNQGLDGSPIECCDKKQPIHPECFPVYLAKGDPLYEKNVTCMNFVRSVPAPTNQFGPREQLNQATAFIDGSVVYGSTEEKVKSLRTFKDGKLEMYLTPDNRTLLPLNRDPYDGCNEAEENAKGRYCFDSGDSRANENLHLTSMHLLFARHHNYIAEQLSIKNPHWSDEKLFQESRKILGAQMQHITYNEFLSVIIGKEASEKFEILSTPDGLRDTYDENVNPSIANEFAAAAFRFAHTLLPGLMKVTKELNDTEESIALHEMLFNPYSLYRPSGLDSALKSLLNTSVERSDPYFTTELTEKLFVHNASPVLCGLDLVSLNIQRGRDHGLPGYSEWRKHCHLSDVDSWEKMGKISDPLSFKRIQQVYKSPRDVDIYTGALAEKPVKGGIIGPLLTCIVSDQFVRIKRGDSFWYERPVGLQKFSSDQLKQIFNTTLSSIICNNSDRVLFSQRYVMKRISKTNPMEKCSELNTFDFEPWKEAKLAKINIGDEEIGVKIKD